MVILFFYTTSKFLRSYYGRGMSCSPSEDPMCFFSQIPEELSYRSFWNIWKQWSLSHNNENTRHTLLQYTMINTIINTTMCDIYKGRVGGGSHPDFLRIKWSNPKFPWKQSIIVPEFLWNFKKIAFKRNIISIYGQTCLKGHLYITTTIMTY